MKVTFAEPAELSSDIVCWLTAIPCNLTGKDVFIRSYLTSGETITTVVGGGKLLADNVNLIEIANLTNVIDATWFLEDADDPREMLDSWAYGPSNTYFAEKKLQKDYKTTVVIDVHARGDYYKCKEPVYYGLLTSSNIEGRPFLQINGSTAYTSRPTNKVSASYTISIDALSSDTYEATGTWGTVAIYDKNYNLLWSYMIIGRYDNDPVQDMDYGTFKMMDRALGASYSSAWLRTNRNDSDSYKSHDEYAAYFQWGRKDPFMWVPTAAYGGALSTSETSVATAISHPTTFYVHDSNKSWSASNPDYRLWGFDGTKTIYDPCPEGYKVPTKDAINTIVKDVVFDDGGSPSGTAVNLAVKNMTVTLPSGSIDYWPYVGCLWGQPSGSFTTKTKAQDSGPLYWANQISSGNGFSIYGFFNGKGVWVPGPTSSQNAKLGFAVRCMKE